MSMESLSDVSPGRQPAKRSKMPPVTEVGVTALGLVVIGGIYMSAYFPDKAPLTLPIVLVVLALALICWNFISIARSDSLPKFPFVKVGKWTLLVYLIIAGMLEYVFVYDGTGGSPLVVLSLMLLVFAVDVPTIVAFTVARFYQSTTEK